MSLILFGYIFPIDNAYIYFLAWFMWGMFLIIFKKYMLNNDIMYINLSILVITLIEVSIAWIWVDWKLVLGQIFLRLIIMNTVYFILNREEINEKL